MNPRVQEVSESDSEPSEMDIDDLPALVDSRHMLRPQSSIVKAPLDREKSKRFQCLYPLYFDKSRTRAEGRRVGQHLAVVNPLAREMADAAAKLGLSTLFEPDKTHPRDWANPGRVRVLLKHNGLLLNEKIKNKHHLYILVSHHLQAHPTERTTPLRHSVAGLPSPKEMPEPAVPKGWKINSILPLHSPALTGGGVSENFLQDMMAEMQGIEPAGSATEAKKKKKDKKKK